MVFLLSFKSLVFYSTLFIFIVISKLIFDNVSLTSHIVIDEEFHFSQGLDYCNYNFGTWNPKITTLPGLYIISSIILGPLDLCTTYWLRFINFIGGLFNFYLIYLWYYLHNKQSWKGLLSSINVALLPPLYFFSHLYYTDVISLTFILLVVVCNKAQKHFIASVCGMMSVLIRQTNIIWVAMVFGQYVLGHLFANYSKKKSKKKSATIKTKKHEVKHLFDIKKVWQALGSLTLQVWLNIIAYSTVIICFGVFVVVNGSIVVGDKTAHEASIHLVQLFYLSLFYLVFAWPYALEDLPNFAKFVWRRKCASIVLLISFAVIVYFNTLVHPYLLADNRHYTFYVWNRFYERYSLFRYAVIPIYYFGLFSLLSRLNNSQNVMFILGYIAGTVLTICLQRMIEVRYFLIPFVLWRMHIKPPDWWQLVLECLSCMVINFVVFYVFFTKDIYWSNFDYAQKLIW